MLRGGPQSPFLIFSFYLFPSSSLLFLILTDLICELVVELPEDLLERVGGDIAVALLVVDPTMYIIHIILYFRLDICLFSNSNFQLSVCQMFIRHFVTLAIRPFKKKSV